MFNNPNQTSACGCGESVQLKPAAEAHGSRRPRAGGGPEDIRELFCRLRAGAVRRMFGGAGIYAGGKMFALVPTASIYLKADEQNAPAFEREKLEPFSYRDGGGKRGVMSYRRMPDRLYDDPDELARLGARCAGGRAAQRQRGRSGKKRTEPAKGRRVALKRLISSRDRGRMVRRGIGGKGQGGGQSPAALLSPEALATGSAARQGRQVAKRTIVGAGLIAAGRLA